MLECEPTFMLECSEKRIVDNYLNHFSDFSWFKQVGENERKQWSIPMIFSEHSTN